MDAKDLKELEALLDSKPAKLSTGDKGSKFSGWSPQLTPRRAKVEELDDETKDLTITITDFAKESIGTAKSLLSATMPSDNIEKEQSELETDTRNSTSKTQAYAKKPKLTKAERRELQEKQRLAKSSQGETVRRERETSDSKALPIASSKSLEKDVSAQPQDVGSKKSGTLTTTIPQSKVIQFFSHLADYKKGMQTASLLRMGGSDIHPSVALLGERYARGEIRGSNARAIALLSALCQFVCDYQTPPDKMLSWDLDKRLRPQIAFLIDCRPHCVSMGTAIKFLRNIVARIPPEMNEASAKKHIVDEIDLFVSERITIAGESIAENGVRKIRDGDVILTFGYSSLVKQILLRAHLANKQFRVIVVDSRPDLEGRIMVAGLCKADIPCTYVLLSAVAYVMREVTKVFIGAGALMANGTALARVGTAVVAMMAYRYRIPILFCCETYKFSERVQLDSIVYNELGHPREILDEGEERQERCLHVLNLKYDLTPIKYVSLIITEVGIIPPTSVPVLLREMNRKEDSGDR